MNITAQNHAAQQRMFKKDEKLIRDLALKIRIFSGVAQNSVLSAIITAQKDYPSYIRQDAKQSLRRVRKALVDLSVDEHAITKDFAIDEYFDDRADDLHRITKVGVERIYKVFQDMFSESKYRDAHLFATLCTACAALNVGIYVLDLTIDQQPICETIKPRCKASFVDPYRRLYKMMGDLLYRVFVKAKADQPLTIDDNHNLVLPETYDKAVEDAITEYGINLVSRETWDELARREHDQLGDKAMLSLNPKSFDEID